MWFFINNSISFNEHCRYIIENKSRNRRDGVSRVVKVPGIILCYMLLIIIIIIIVVVVVVVTKKCSIHHETMWIFSTWKASQSRQELNYSPNPIIPPALLNSAAIRVMTVGFMDMARLSSSSSPRCLGYIYTMPLRRCVGAILGALEQRLGFQKGGGGEGNNHNSNSVPFAYFAGTKWTTCTSSACRFL